MADEERWRRSLAKQHSGKKKNNGTPQVVIDRYKFDVEQANAMKGRRAPTTTTVDKDVQLGLQGLEEADSLHKHGNSEKSLKLYGQSIELLLRCLKQSGSFDRDVVSARVTVALSDAEEIKARLQQEQKSPQPASQPSGESPTSWTSLTSSLSAALQKTLEKEPAASNRSKPSPTTNIKPLPRKSPRSDAPRRRTRLDYDNDPYVQTVKADLYVDPSELQSTTWDDVAGLENAKRSLQESAILPLIRPDLYTGLRKPQNILLYGPPGTGKTMLVRAVAHESQCLLFACSASALTSKWLGEGEKLVRTLFRVASDVAPSIIFVDEMDALLSSRKADEHEATRRFKTEFMIQMDGLKANEGSVLVVGCTNCPWDVDDAVMRRFPRRIYVPLPDLEARRGLLQVLLKKAGPHNLSSSDIFSIAQKMEGFSCSDISSIASEASFGPLRSMDMATIRDVRASAVRKISKSDFDTAIKSSTKSVTPSLLAKYKQWEKQQAA
jgi:ATP-dependent 26S proteasome regulatory subunit